MPASALQNVRTKGRWPEGKAIFDRRSISRLLMTLVALFALTTGARAGWSGGTYTATATENLGEIMVNGDATLTINSDVTVTVNGGITVASGTLTVTGPGTLVVTGSDGGGGNDGIYGGAGGNGGAAICGNIIVQGGATVTATGGYGGNGGNGNAEGGNGGTGGAAISGNVTIYSGTIEATGGVGGDGGDGNIVSGTGGDGGNGGHAFAGTLTYYGGKVNATGGSGGSGGSGKITGDDAVTFYAFANDVDFFQTANYTMYSEDTTSNVISVEGYRNIIIDGADFDPNAVAITWDNAAKTATIASMPAGNVEVNVNYFAQAELAMSTDATPVAIAPAAIPGVPANTDDPIVTPGTVANIGTSEVPQGTLMYFVRQSTGNTAPTAPDYNTEGWSEDVPTANGLAEGDVYVWYYIKGAEPAQVADRTDANTCSDSDIMPLGSNGIVTLAAEPTYDLTLKAANANTIDATQASKGTVTVKEGTAAAVDKTGDITAEGKLTAIKRGSEVKLKANNGYKFRKVEAKKSGPVDNTYLKWDANQKELVAADIPATVTTVANADADVTWSAGTHVVEGDVTINGTITLNGNVVLIIKDGAKLTAKQINGSNSYYNLSIYGQANQTGQLVVNCSNTDAISRITTLEVHSCQVTATSSRINCGGFYFISTFNVYGGSVDGENIGTQGYGISLSGNGSMNIYGGDVKAVGKGNLDINYGIRTSIIDSATVTVYGGKLWAESAGKEALHSNITLTKGVGFTGKIETSGDGSSWTEYTTTGTPETKYVRVGY